MNPSSRWRIQTEDQFKSNQARHVSHASGDMMILEGEEQLSNSDQSVNNSRYRPRFIRSNDWWQAMHVCYGVPALHTNCRLFFPANVNPQANLFFYVEQQQILPSMLSITFWGSPRRSLSSFMHLLQLPLSLLQINLFKLPNNPYGLVTIPISPPQTSLPFLQILGVPLTPILKGLIFGSTLILFQHFGQVLSLWNSISSLEHSSGCILPMCYGQRAVLILFSLQKAHYMVASGQLTR